MITRLQKINSLPAHLVYHAMLLCDSSRPQAAQLVLECLRFANALEWIFDNILHQQQNAKSYLPVRPDPPSQVLCKLRLEYSLPFNWSAQDLTVAAVARSFPAYRGVDLLR